MKESPVEKLANKLQLFWFIIDCLSNDEKINPNIVNKAIESLDDIKKLLLETDIKLKNCEDFNSSK